LNLCPKFFANVCLHFWNLYCVPLSSMSW
jgi:hypothetical protein